MKKTILSLIAALGLATGAQAATYQGLVSGSATPTDFSTDGLISFDLDFAALGTTTLRYTIGAGDLASLSFNAVLRNFTDEGLSSYLISLSTGSFLPVGTVTPQFGTLDGIAWQDGNATISFGALEFLDTMVGDPLTAGGGKIDWALTGFNVGDTLEISVSAVPEPETYAMLLAGLGALFAARRRQQRRQA
ncbi:MAG: PEP-CTERM sorting domain-containing protein [Hydrogenophaga sp.]|jgi:hypothetical protein